MPNGKGALECCYCIHYKGQWSGYDAAHEPGFCTYHNAALPGTTDTHLNRICCNFSSNDDYDKHNPLFESDGRLKTNFPGREILLVQDPTEGRHALCLFIQCTGQFERICKTCGLNMREREWPNSRVDRRARSSVVVS